MKNKYLNVWRLQAFIITSVLLFPVAAYSQDLTEEQKKERCQNNKNRIVELETQLKVIDADLSASMTIKEIEDARTQMVFVTGIKKTVKSDLQRRDISLKGHLFGVSYENWNKFDMISGRYNFNILDCIDLKFENEELDIEKIRLDCVTELEKIIANKINKATSLNRPALLAKKNEIEKQLASHRNNLIALRCDEPAGNDFDYSKISGIWQSDWGPVTLSVSNYSVSGNWKQSATETGQITGGLFDVKTKTLTFTYSQAWNKMTGKVTLGFSETGTGYSLSGSWRHDNGSNSGSWGLTRSK